VRLVKHFGYMMYIFAPRYDYVVRQLSASRILKCVDYSFKNVPMKTSLVDSFFAHSQIAIEHRG